MISRGLAVGVSISAAEAAVVLMGAAGVVTLSAAHQAADGELAAT